MEKKNIFYWLGAIVGCIGIGVTLVVVSILVYMPGAFVPMIVFASIFLFAGGIVIPISFIIIYSSKYKKKYIIIKARHGHALIDPEARTLKYRKNFVSVDDITSYELHDKSQMIMKSSLGEAVVGGLLFGSVGAAAGAYAGKHEKLKEKCKVYIKTKDIRNAGFVVNTSLDCGFKLFETLERLINK